MKNNICNAIKLANLIKTRKLTLENLTDFRCGVDFVNYIRDYISTEDLSWLLKSSLYTNTKVEKPTTISDYIFALSAGKCELETAIGNYLHQIKKMDIAQLKETVSEEPRWYFNLPPTVYIYFAGLAEYLCNKHGIKGIEWYNNGANYSYIPVFAFNQANRVKNHLLNHTPIEFKKRNMFITESGLTII